MIDVGVIFRQELADFASSLSLAEYGGVPTEQRWHRRTNTRERRAQELHLKKQQAIVSRSYAADQTNVPALLAARNATNFFHNKTKQNIVSIVVTVGILVRFIGSL